MQVEQKENTHSEDAPRPEDNKPDNKRERSTIEFAYSDLDDAIGVARAIANNAGMSCTLDQLAAYLKQSMNSGTFRLRTSNARIFGLTENERGELRLTDLGRRIADESQEAEARVEAFLHVPLYGKIFEDFKGYSLPNAAAIERHMVQLGVANKQKGRARQAFMRSARQAGFFVHGEDRLVRPAPFNGNAAQSKPFDAKERDDGNGSSGGTGGGGGGEADDLKLDQLLMALLRKIPPKDEGWGAPKRLRWFRTFAMNVSQIYDGDEDVVELKIDLAETKPL